MNNKKVDPDFKKTYEKNVYCRVEEILKNGSYTADERECARIAVTVACEAVLEYIELSGSRDTF